MVPLKIIVVGDVQVGKTSLLITYATGSYPLEYIPEVFDNYAFQMTCDEKEYSLGLWDIPRQIYDTETPRSRYFPDTNVFIVCFSVVDRYSFENAKNKWIKDIYTNLPGVAIILCGTKTDLRQTHAATNVSHSEGVHLAKDCNAYKYVECSSLKHPEAVHKVFEEAVRAAVSAKSHSSSDHQHCILM